MWLVLPLFRWPCRGKVDRRCNSLDKLRRTVSDGSLSVVSVGSNASANFSPTSTIPPLEP